MSFRPNGIVTLTTDFGLSDAYVAAMKGVILTLAPEARIVDVTHLVPPQQVQVGALILAAAAPWFPAGTVHLAVVDPGVGTRRRPVALFANGQAFVGPDNGLLTLAAGPRAPGRLLGDRTLTLPHLSSTFHGRDLFAPVAAMLAGGLAPERLGPPARGLKPLDLPRPRKVRGGWEGQVVAVDGFGNAITNLDEALLARAFGKRPVTVTAEGRPIRGISRTYGDHAPGTLVAVIGSAGFLEIAVVNGSAEKGFGLKAGAKVRVTAQAFKT